ncbi:SDR family NAD(P)-dependent oxidoreductase [Thalassotalea euphylliae]|uniref:SDR family NAD(P)-dependent oxidoreductase n=1 Tax=Thalassotalea euphylliae TaxID=1655234 RepID=A0A3E0TSC8_9GAMM|nr:SDR family NAD(P)-dependent oxidoreductase [Thalassotalea euphylliae]REL26882.1 SDR family NAD(P)-dependent oxidoreductase [Thalassotalea euphylliae]
MRVLITGATSGIGEALVATYLEAGHTVIACGRSDDKLQVIAKQSESLAGTLECSRFDITKRDEIEAAIGALSSVDIAILNAGDCEYIDDPFHFDSALFERVIHVNLIAMGHLISTLIPKIAKGGQLALMSSSVTNLPFPRAQAYGASKAGVDYLAHTMRLELEPYDIDVSLIHPGFIKTPLTDKNDFDMPFLLTAADAANRIAIGLDKRKAKLEFPKRFIYLLKFISWLPSFVWTGLNRKAVYTKFQERKQLIDNNQPHQNTHSGSIK